MNAPATRGELMRSDTPEYDAPLPRGLKTGQRRESALEHIGPILLKALGEVDEMRQTHQENKGPRQLALSLSPDVELG
jgi:hypothetical protein